jgi:hypothetical protein
MTCARGLLYRIDIQFMVKLDNTIPKFRNMNKLKIDISIQNIVSYSEESVIIQNKSFKMIGTMLSCIRIIYQIYQDFNKTLNKILLTANYTNCH